MKLYDDQGEVVRDDSWVVTTMGGQVQKAWHPPLDDIPTRASGPVLSGAAALAPLGALALWLAFAGWLIWAW